ncbi:MAG TPA: hypothetical protein VFZ08_01300 [Terriglobia bacterium]|nr:hypothetical protein [Terriglobia bacterium]
MIRARYARNCRQDAGATSSILLAVIFVLAVLGAGNTLHAQSLLTDALSWLPPQTIALEYSRPATLRSLSNYQSLRSRFLGRNLKSLESSLAKIGIHEEDIDEMALGWQSGAGKEMRYEGLALGRFDPARAARQAAAAGIKPHRVGDFSAYCFADDPNSSCVVVMDTTLGAFGPLAELQSMVKVRSGNGPSIAANTQFTDFVRSAESDSPIWGVALGGAVSKWFKAWMPGEKNLQMDWANAFKNVRALSYQIEAEDNVNLHVKMDCTTPQAASSVRQLLDGLRLLQQLAWQSANPGQPNPFQNLQVEASDRQVSFRLTADYAALEHVGPLGRP